MAGTIRISTDQVEQIATNIEKQNQKLLEELNASKQDIQNLSASWEGEAFDSVKRSYNEFSAKYFKTYHDVMNAYVLFLRNNVSKGYFETETSNISLSDAFK